MRTLQPDLRRHLSAIAAAEIPSEMSEPLAAARFLSGGRVLQVFVPGAAPDFERVSGVVRLVDDPEDADVAVVVHMPDAEAKATAAEVENQVTLGNRVVLVDLSQPGQDKADPDLLVALTNTSVYVSNLAAYDVDLERAITAALTPLRDGAAHRLYLAETMLYYWAWRSIIQGEVERFFGDTIPESRMLRATTQARSRLGALLIKLRSRGLRYFVRAVGFEQGRVSGFWFDLTDDA